MLVTTEAVSEAIEETCRTIRYIESPIRRETYITNSKTEFICSEDLSVVERVIDEAGVVPIEKEFACRFAIAKFLYQFLMGSVELLHLSWTQDHIKVGLDRSHCAFGDELCRHHTEAFLC